METWKDVIDFEGLYEVSDMGNIRRSSLIEWRKNKRGFIYKRTLKKRTIKGYSYKGTDHLRVNIYKDGKACQVLVHRLVAIAFVENPLKMECVNHVDGDKFNNKASNLEWCTRSENILHAYKIGLMDWNKGSTHPQSKLTESDIPIIKGLYNHLCCTCEQVGSIYSVTRTAVRKIIDNKSWTHI